MSLYPELLNVETGLGPVRIAFTDGTHCHVSTQARSNDDKPCIVYRNQEIMVSVHLTVDEDGTWFPKNASMHKLNMWPKSDEVAVTHRRAILDAITSTVQTSAAPEILATAEQQDTLRELERAKELFEKISESAKNAKDFALAAEQKYQAALKRKSQILDALSVGNYERAAGLSSAATRVLVRDTEG